MCDRDLQLFGDPYQVGERRCPHLLHDLAAVDLNGDLTDAEFRSRLLVQEPADHKRQHLPLPRRKSFQATTKLGQLRPCLSLNAVPIDRRPDCSDQIVLPDRLGQKVDGAAPNGTHR